MRIVVQRVTEASVTVLRRKIGVIDKGLMLLVGVAEGDTADIVRDMAFKISRMRIFEDEVGKMNLDIISTGGSVLSVPQFTLLADTEKGNRPGFDGAASPHEARTLWEIFNDSIREKGIPVEVGEFGAVMAVSLVNDGPVTFVLDSKAQRNKK
jgi:D-tyrosyl-tRNA(Tyr) deacylase